MPFSFGTNASLPSNMRNNKMKLLFWVCGGLFHLLIDVKAIEYTNSLPKHLERILSSSRRILNGEPVADSRPYMVYLKLPKSNAKTKTYRKWLCGGTIIHEEYVLTSAACIQDVEHFYVVSGTYKYSDDDDRFTNPCIRNGAKKAIWICVPKNYVFDGHENDNIRWMNNDIAIVRVEDSFDFTRKVRGCEFIPKPVCYNNETAALEAPGTMASIAGWGTTERYNDWISRKNVENAQNLLTATVEIISKNRCKRRWGARYANVIDNYMICTKDIGQTMTEICQEKFVDCQDINYSNDEEDARRDGVRVMKTIKVPVNLYMHSAFHNETRRSKQHVSKKIDGGFCENDHGGPLIYGAGVNSIVIGVISACLVKERTNKCFGPFLYTSVYKNRQFISCSIFKDVEPKCRRQFRAGETHTEKVVSWVHHEDGPSKNEIPHIKAPEMPPVPVPVHQVDPSDVPLALELQHLQERVKVEAADHLKSPYVPRAGNLFIGNLTHEQPFMRTRDDAGVIDAIVDIANVGVPVAKRANLGEPIVKISHLEETTVKTVNVEESTVKKAADSKEITVKSDSSVATTVKSEITELITVKELDVAPKGR